jgi:hypothetical protein
MVLRSVFAWVLFMGAEKAEFRETLADGESHSDYRYPVPGGLHCAVATVISFAVIFGASQVWNAKVEPIFAKITSTLEKVVSGKAGVFDLLVVEGKVQNEKEMLLPIRQD